MNNIFNPHLWTKTYFWISEQSPSTHAKKYRGFYREIYTEVISLTLKLSKLVFNKIGHSKKGIDKWRLIPTEIKCISNLTFKIILYWNTLVNLIAVITKNKLSSYLYQNIVSVIATITKIFPQLLLLQW